MKTFVRFVGPKVGSVEWVITQTGVGALQRTDIEQYKAEIVDQDARHRRQVYCNENPVRGWLARHTALIAGVAVFLTLAWFVYIVVNPIKNPLVFWVYVVGILLFVGVSTFSSDIFFKPYMYAERGWEKKQIGWYYSDEFTKLCEVQGMKLYQHVHPFFVTERPLFSVVGRGDSGKEVEYFLCSSSRS